MQGLGCGRGARLLESRRGGSVMTDPSAIAKLLALARRHLDRVLVEDLADEVARGAILIDIRPLEQRRRDGELPSSPSTSTCWSRPLTSATRAARDRRHRHVRPARLLQGHPVGLDRLRLGDTKALALECGLAYLTPAWDCDAHRHESAPDRADPDVSRCRALPNTGIIVGAWRPCLSGSGQPPTRTMPGAWRPSSPRTTEVRNRSIRAAALGGALKYSRIGRPSSRACR